MVDDIHRTIENITILKSDDMDVVVLHQVATSKFIASVTGRSVMVVPVQFNAKSYLWAVKI